MLTHVVMIWFREDAPSAAVARFRARATADLRDIPGVQHLRCGTPIPTERAVVDKSYSVALAMAFDGRRELDAYAVHPVHQKFMEECIQPFAARVVVYDFE
ncbi:MAG: Dabb family protein [Verrucomicrobiae bacterium]|nr:Dabb family protein [Verrucomicrobiae bacterium]